MDLLFKSIYSTVTSNIQKSLGQCSGWIIDSAIDHNISISRYNSLGGSSYYHIKGFINIQNVDDNECFKEYLVILNGI